MARFILGHGMRGLGARNTRVERVLYRLDRLFFGALLWLIRLLPVDLASRFGAAVGRICGRAPLASLSHLLKCAEPRLRCLLTRQKLVERQQVRSRAAEVLRRQDEQTYQPMRVWLGKTEDAWVDRFTPIGQTRTQASVSRPAGTTAWPIALDESGKYAALAWTCSVVIYVPVDHTAPVLEG